MKSFKIIPFLLALFLFAACSSGNQGDDAATELSDRAKLYAVAIREIQSYARSHQSVYVVTKTEDLSISEAPQAPSQSIPAELQQAISDELSDARFEISWIGEFDDAPLDPTDWRSNPGWKIDDGNGMVITLGNLHPQEDETVQLSFWMSCADMCGVGKIYVLEKTFDSWHIKGTVGPEIAS